MNHNTIMKITVFFNHFNLFVTTHSLMAALSVLINIIRGQINNEYPSIDRYQVVFNPLFWK